MFYLKIARLDSMKDDYLPVRDPRVPAGLFSLRQTVQWGIHNLRAVFPSVGGVKGPGRNGDKTF
jgi:hypothetical protein